MPGKRRPEKKRQLSQVRFAPEYRTALEFLWNGQPRKAIETLTAALDQDRSAPEALSLYRLWIEALAVQNETAALRNLLEHLRFVSEVAEGFKYQWTALCGVIHFELDEVEAASLLARSVSREMTDPYVAELLQRVEGRRQDKKIPQPLWDLKDVLSDYCHLETLAKQTQVCGFKDKQMWILEKIRTLYPASPLPSLYLLHNWVEGRDFKAAKQLALDLAKAHPQNATFAFHAGSIAAQAQDFETAITELTRAVNLDQANDPDVLSWLGFSLAEKALRTRSSVLKNEAETYLKKAVQALREAGLPVTFPARQLALLGREFTNGVSMSREARLWMVKYAPAEFHHLKTAAKDDVKIVSRPMGKDAKAGDFCLVVGDDYVTKQLRERRTVWRIGALYSVVSDAYWHPYHGFICDLQLVNRQDAVSVPVDVTAFIAHQNGDGKGLERDDPRQFGVFELDSQAQQAIAETLQQYAEEGREIVSSLNQLRQSV